MAKRKVNKFEAVRQALSELGSSAAPIQIQSHLKGKGIEMTTKHISTYKGSILKGKPAVAKQPTARPAAAKPVAATPSVNGAAKSPVHGAGSLSQQVAMLKAVAGTIGRAEAKAILDLF
jgi:hypothetical protein